MSVGGTDTAASFLPLPEITGVPRAVAFTVRGNAKKPCLVNEKGATALWHPQLNPSHRQYLAYRAALRFGSFARSRYAGFCASGRGGRGASHSRFVPMALGRIGRVTSSLSHNNYSSLSGSPDFTRGAWIESIRPTRPNHLRFRLIPEGSHQQHRLHGVSNRPVQSVQGPRHGPG